MQSHLHDLWPELALPGGAWFSATWGNRIARHLARSQQTMRAEIAQLVADVASQVLTESKTTREAIRCLKRHLARRISHLL